MFWGESAERGEILSHSGNRGKNRLREEKASLTFEKALLRVEIASERGEILSQRRNRWKNEWREEKASLAATTQQTNHAQQPIEARRQLKVAKPNSHYLQKASPKSSPVLN
ncbi:hypothetical protein [Paenibacillus albus]|uniref:Uncharacterized protein n=1 Tax=Paenibacillus albus TaxID=2495582 RepID=A0A3S9A2A0_9BACL|nr:hypothetical protein [Paenibacillus albus]AZN39900.1 hypothetical protein EJC50_09750 [Paenibacillus albus]